MVLHSLPIVIFFLMPVLLLLPNIGVRSWFTTFFDFLKGMSFAISFREQFSLSMVSLFFVIKDLMMIVIVQFSSIAELNEDEQLFAFFSFLFFLFKIKFLCLSFQS